MWFLHTLMLFKLGYCIHKLILTVLTGPCGNLTSSTSVRSDSKATIPDISGNGITDEPEKDGIQAPVRPIFPPFPQMIKETVNSSRGVPYPIPIAHRNVSIAQGNFMNKAPSLSRSSPVTAAAIHICVHQKATRFPLCADTTQVSVCCLIHRI